MPLIILGVLVSVGAYASKKYLVYYSWLVRMPLMILGVVFSVGADASNNTCCIILGQ